jgi:hypothetical protein
MDLTATLLDSGLEIKGEPVLDNTIHRVKHRGSKDKRGWHSGVILNGQVYTYGRSGTMEKDAGQIRRSI